MSVSVGAAFSPVGCYKSQDASLALFCVEECLATTTFFRVWGWWPTTATNIICTVVKLWSHSDPHLNKWACALQTMTLEVALHNVLDPGRILNFVFFLTSLSSPSCLLIRRLDGNPWHCTCPLWTLRWLLSIQSDFNASVRCNNLGNRTLLNVTYEELCPGELLINIFGKAYGFTCFFRDTLPPCRWLWDPYVIHV